VLESESIRSIKGANKVSFDLVEEKTHARMSVLYDNKIVALPANFPNASHAKVNGYYDRDAGRFVADAAMTKCPTKYDQDIQPTVPPEVMARWKQATEVASAP